MAKLNHLFMKPILVYSNVFAKYKKYIAQNMSDVE